MSDMRIVVVSGWDDAVLRREAAACGASYLCKPLARTELLRTIGLDPDTATRATRTTGPVNHVGQP